MKITIVPDITSNAGLNGQPFDSTLEPELLDWFNNLKNIWGMCKFHPFSYIYLFLYLSFSFYFSPSHHTRLT